MTVRSAALAALLALCACAGARDHVIAFDPGQHTARVQDVRVDIVEARYAERQLTVQCTVTNEGSSPVTIERDGILLEDDGLELPPTPLAGQPDRLDLAAGDSTLLLLAFPVGGHEPRMRRLGLWVLRSEAGPLPPLRIDVPGIRTESATKHIDRLASTTP